MVRTASTHEHICQQHHALHETDKWTDRGTSPPQSPTMYKPCVTRKPTRHMGIENDDAARPTNLSLALSPSYFTPYPQSWSFHALAPWSLVPTGIKNSYIRFQNITLASLTTDKLTGGSMNKWTRWKHQASACQSGLVEAYVAALLKSETIVHNFSVTFKANISFNILNFNKPLASINVTFNNTI